MCVNEITKENYNDICEYIAFSDKITEKEKESIITFVELWGKLESQEEAKEIYNTRFSQILKKKYGYRNDIDIASVFDILSDLCIIAI